MPLFVTVVFALIVLQLRLSYLNKNRNGAHGSERYLKEDFEANLSRARPIDDDMYIKLTEEDFPFRGGYDESVNIEKAIFNIQKRVRLCLEAPIIKTDIQSNIELKKRFGAANLQAVTDGEENHTRLIQGLNKWAKLLVELGNTEDARLILERAVLARSDISETYILLYNLYRGTSDCAKISELNEEIERLPDAAKKRVKAHISSLG